jgi:hypothetical protein
VYVGLLFVMVAARFENGKGNCDILSMLREN